jgi:hypothetical protein
MIVSPRQIENGPAVTTIFSRLCGAILLAAIPAAASAQSDAVKEMAGAWQISNVDRDRVCAIEFKTDAVKGGYRAELDRSCVDAFPTFRDVHAWTLNDETVRLIDSKGQQVLRFEEVEAGMYESDRAAGEGLLFLQSAASIAPAGSTVEQVAGDWAIRDAGNVVCSLTLAANEAGEDAYALGLRPGCDPAVTGFNPVSWRLDRGELVITGKNGDTWRFEQGDTPGTWQKIPFRPDGVTLTRK